MFDLAIAVLAGVIVSSLVFSWENAKRIRARKFVDEHGVKHMKYTALYSLAVWSYSIVNSMLLTTQRNYY